MKTLIYLFIAAILLSGCSTITDIEPTEIVNTKTLSNLNPKKIVSPAEYYYYQGNQLYDEQEYDQAIEKYKLSLEANENSAIATSVKINLGMSYYLTDNFEEAHETLKDVRINDEQIKMVIDEKIEYCKSQIEKDKPADEKEVTEDAPSSEKIEITVIDAFIKDSSLIVEGKVSRRCKVIINNFTIDLNDDNTFSSSIDWKKGKPVIIMARDDKGSSVTKEYFPDSEEPDAPVNIRTSSITSSSIEIEWDENTEPDIKGYKLYYNLKGNSPQEINEIITDTKYEIVGLDQRTQGTNRTFQFRLRAVDKMNNYSDLSNIYEETLP